MSSTQKHWFHLWYLAFTPLGMLSPSGFGSISRRLLNSEFWCSLLMTWRLKYQFITTENMAGHRRCLSVTSGCLWVRSHPPSPRWRSSLAISLPPSSLGQNRQQQEVEIVEAFL